MDKLLIGIVRKLNKEIYLQVSAYSVPVVSFNTTGLISNIEYSGVIIFNSDKDKDVLDIEDVIRLRLDNLIKLAYNINFLNSGIYCKDMDSDEFYLT